MKVKNNKSIKTLLSIVILSLIVAGVYFGYTKIYKPYSIEYKATIKEENGKYLKDIIYKEGSYIEILDNKKEVKETLKLDNNNPEIILKPASDTEDKFFTEWEIVDEVKEFKEFYKLPIPYFKAIPQYENKEDFIITFKADQNSKLLSNNKELEFIKKPYSIGENIQELFPEIKINENYNGKWTLNNKELDPNEELKANSEIVFTTFQDINKNNIDDLSEEFTVKFITNLENVEISDKKAKWNEKINLPKTATKTKMFYNWYIDKEQTKLFTEETPITSDLILYAETKDIDQIINNTINNPILRQDVAEQVKARLNQRNKAIDEKFLTEKQAKEKALEEKRKEQEENNKIIQEEQSIIQFHNVEHEKLHLITFLNPNGVYIYSIVAPYGQTIKLVKENGLLDKEYSVRQNSSIILDQNKLLTNSSELDFYHSEYRKLNNTVFIKIQPLGK